MIIQIRGTSGSGKTTVMKAVMANFQWSTIYQTGRKQPLYYYSKTKTGRPLIALGHYESACGGCDTIGSAAQVAELVKSLTQAGPDRIILSEGLLLSEDTKWSSLMPDLHIVYLTTPIEQCISQIKSRRAEAGNNKPLNESNSRNRVKVIDRSRIKLMSTAVCRRAPASQAAKIIRDWIDQCTTQS